MSVHQSTNNNTQAKWQEPSKWAQRPVCVLGAGVLGRRIAACFIAAGYEVRIRDPSEHARSQAQGYLHSNINSFTALTNRDAGPFKATEDLAAAVADCWLVLEAVPEILALKEDTFHDLEKQAPEDCILATNSSSYKSSELLSKVSDQTKSRALNTHFMMPPEVRKSL